jgi:hypothetical protein
MLAAAIVALLLPTGATPGEGGAGALPGVESSSPAWELQATLLGYSLPDEADFLLPIVTADRGPLHLEGRYQYEDRETVSLFVGWGFELGDELTLELVPMVGAVAGRTDGIAPALELTVAWGPLELYSESEYVVDLEESASSFFYAWSELSAWPTEWLRVGAALQRTRVFEAAREVSAGPLVGLAIWKLSATFYLLEPGRDEQFAIASVGASF